MPRRWPTSTIFQPAAVCKSVQLACNRPATVREVFLLFLLTLSIFWVYQRHAEASAVYVPDARPGHVIT